MSLMSYKIKAAALRLGFSVCGIAPVHSAERDAEYLKVWLDASKHAGMRYMENYLDKRRDPRLLVEGTRSIVSVALNYYPRQLLGDDQYQFARYAYGKDYHTVMRQKLHALLSFINEQVCPTSGRAFCDTAPVPERYWAWCAGLGSIGKHTQLIVPGAGSHFFLGELFLDIELEYDVPLESSCGGCTRCLEACPTGALEQPYRLNAGNCLSYLTIEHRGAFSPEETITLNSCIYGCDECQKACPQNRFAVPCSTPELQPSSAFLQMRKEDWHELTEEQYKSLFKDSAVKRTKYEGLVRNIKAASRK